MTSALALTVLTTPLAICRSDPGAREPTWLTNAAAFVSVTRTASELSIVVDEAIVPPAAQAARGYRALRVEGPLGLELVGVIAVLCGTLASVGVPVFPIATYETDYLLVPGVALVRALDALRLAGHSVVEEPLRTT